jgi:sugar phosphate isomerase/epimerase
VVKRMTRRQVLGTSIASAGMLLSSTSFQKESNKLKTEGTTKIENFLTPWSPPEELKRDLTPGQSPIRLSCSSYTLYYTKGMDILGCVKKIREKGYTACEGGHEWKDASDSDIRETHDVLKEYDVLFYGLHMAVNNIHPDLSVRRKNQKQVAEMIEAAERIGLPFVVSHTGSCSEETTATHRDNWTMKTWKESVEAIKQILKDTEGSKVNIGIEAVNATNINNPRAHVRFKEDVGDPRIKVTLDPTNMMNPNVYYRSTELINECFDLIGEDIMYAHAKDVYWTPQMLPTFTWVIPGIGTMDYETYLTRLSRLKYPRPLLLEFLKEEEYPQAKKFIEDIAKRIGVTINA